VFGGIVHRAGEENRLSVSATIEPPYLLFLGDESRLPAAKTAAGIKQWRPERCAGQLRLSSSAVDLGVPDMSIPLAAQRGVRTLILGTVNPGGSIPESWVNTIIQALEAGLDVASGMHQKLSDIPAIREAAQRTGRRLFDVRHTQQRFATGTGEKRSGLRLLTVGTDCIQGKKYTALALEQEMRRHGFRADFRATGQTGILITGAGVAIDAVVADFIAGAAEWLSPVNDADHWDIIEGQGSLFHPAYAGVTLGLIHGSQPDALVMCHDPLRQNLLGLNFPVPDLLACIAANQAAARLTNPSCKVIGVSINSSQIPPADIEPIVKEIEDRTGLPCCDPLRHGVKKFLPAVQAITHGTSAAAAQPR
jgi:uncharacterized NAD-dependent epimerase/dehydratase family protein